MAPFGFASAKVRQVFNKEKKQGIFLRKVNKKVQKDLFRLHFTSCKKIFSKKKECHFIKNLLAILFLKL